MDTQATTRKRHRGEAGFTLVELMVVIAIIATLAAIVGYNVMGNIDQGNYAAAQAQISNFKTALIAYKLKHKKFPSTGEGLQSIAEFLDPAKVPTDPWGNEYRYELIASNQFKIVSLGADGAPGGEGEFDKDIDSTELQE